MSEDKLTHVIIPIEDLEEYTKRPCFSLEQKRAQEVVREIIDTTKYPHINYDFDAQQSYIKQLEDALHDVDFDLSMMEDYLHGEEGNKITAMRKRIQQALKHTTNDTR